ncbi:MAG TPA: hypothetical protein VKG63_08635 [Steroidobacteraceae bacterium]|nr:hypothetical protein [Steroidobacteraceae bacterium]
MRSTHHQAIPLLLALVLGGAALPAFADDACVDFKWDVRAERALFAQTPTALAAGQTAASAAAVVPNRPYSLRLLAQDQVAFVAAPGKKLQSPPAYGGLAKLQIAAPGSYRISVDLPLWIDVVAQGALVPASDFQGQHSCSAPHKIVVFDLTGVQPFVLQLSNAASATVLLTITPAPARKL